MATLNPALSHSCRAAACALVLLLGACGGGGGADGPNAAPMAAAAVIPAGADVAAQPAGASPVVVPSPPDMSIAPPPGTVVTPPLPDATAGIASVGIAPTDGAVNAANAALNGAAPAGASSPAVAVMAPALPEGAIACQPSTCPGFASNGSVTNTQGTSDPTAAGAYLLPAGVPTGNYPDLGGLRTMVLPPVPVSIDMAP